MKKRVASLLLVLLLLLSLFSGCSEDSLNIAYPVAENVRTLDPQYASSSTAQLIAVNCFEGLVAVDETGEIILDIDEDDFNGVTVTEGEMIEITGEIDKEMMKPTEVNVKQIKKMDKKHKK